jgi:hypothetical protein
MTVLPELERQLVKAAGSPRALVSPAPRARLRGWMAVAAGCLAAGIVVLVFAAVGSKRRHATAGSPTHVTVLDPRVPATYAQACATTFDCLTVPPGRVPAALRQRFHVPRLRAGERCPTTAGTPFMNSYFGGVGLGTAPVRPDIGNGGEVTHGRIDLGTTEDPGWFGIKTVWYSVPSYHGPWSVRAVRLGGSGRIDLGSEPAPRPARGGSPFSPVAVGAAPGDTINTGDGYRTDPRTTWISAPGCYAFQVSGLGFSELIVFQALPHARP